jgi:hypothetical protein
MATTECDATDCRRTERLTAFRYPYALPGGASQDMLLCPTHLRLMKRLASESEKTRRLVSEAGLLDESGAIDPVKLARELKHQAFPPEQRRARRAATPAWVSRPRLLWPDHHLRSRA